MISRFPKMPLISVDSIWTRTRVSNCLFCWLLLMQSSREGLFPWWHVTIMTVPLRCRLWSFYAEKLNLTNRIAVAGHDMVSKFHRCLLQLATHRSKKGRDSRESRLFLLRGNSRLRVKNSRDSRESRPVLLRRFWFGDDLPLGVCCYGPCHHAQKLCKKK